MVGSLLVRQVYRLYAAMLLIWCGWSLVWDFFSVEMAATTIGMGWLVIAGIGIPITAGLYASRSSVFDTTPGEINRFQVNSASGVPLVTYAALLVIWSAVFAGWSAGLLEATTVVGYGWLAIAGYGAVLTAGLVSTHRSEVLDAVGLRTAENERL